MIQRAEHLSDVVVELESFAGSPKEANPMFKDYHGLLHVKKLPAFNTLVHQDALYSDLAFKLRRKKFLIEVGNESSLRNFFFLEQSCLLQVYYIMVN